MTSERVQDLIKAVEQLPAFPSNLENQTIYNEDKTVKTYGPHDPQRVELEQKIVAYARANVIYTAAVIDNMDREEFMFTVKRIVSQSTGGEAPSKDLQAIRKRVNALASVLQSDIHEQIYRISEGDYEAKDIHLEQIRSEFKKSADMKEISRLLSDVTMIERDGNKYIGALNDILKDKGYQLNLNDGSLHCTSNERVHVKGQRLDDLVDTFNRTAGAGDLEKKREFYEEYFKNLATSKAYKDKQEITIMDVGVENGELTKYIAETALKHFPDKKINIIAVERSGNFLEEANPKLEKLVADNEDKLSYTAVIHHIGGKDAPVESIKNVDIFLLTDVRNFNTVSLVKETKLYASENAVMLLKHGDKQDFQENIRAELKGHVRNAADKSSMIEADLRSIDHDQVVTGQIKSAFGFGFGKISDETKDKLISIKKGDYLDQPFKEGTDDYNKQRVLEFILGCPIAAFEKDVRGKAIDLFNKEMEKGYAILSSGCQLLSVHNKEISHEQQQAFNQALKEINPMTKDQDINNSEWRGRNKG